jgi:hypothetical protein
VYWPIPTWPCPGLLAYRIWAIECTVSTVRATKGTATPVMRLLMDAALLYSVTLLPALICFACSNNGQFVVIDMVIPLLQVVEHYWPPDNQIIPVISIAFYMVLIRIAISRWPQDHFSMEGQPVMRKRSNPRQHTLKPLQVHISHNDDGTSAYVLGNQDRSSTYCKPDSVESEWVFATCKL